MIRNLPRLAWTDLLFALAVANALFAFTLSAFPEGRLARALGVAPVEAAR